MKQIKDQIHTSKKLKQQCVHIFFVDKCLQTMSYGCMIWKKKEKFDFFYTSNDIYPNIGV